MRLAAEHAILALTCLLLLLRVVRQRRFRKRAHQLAEQLKTLARDGGAVPAAKDPLDEMVAVFDRLLDDAAERHHERTALFSLITRLTVCDTVEDAHAVLKCGLRELFINDGGAVYIGDGGRHTFFRVVGFRDTLLPEQFGHTQCLALRRRKTRVGQDPGPCVHQVGEPSMCVPIQCKGRPFGILCLRLHSSSLDSRGGVPPAKRLLAESVARHIAFVLTSLQLRATLQFQSMRDPLTGLYNRRFFEETLTRELRTSQRRQEPLSLLVIDVDHFKRVNDTHGHPGGDALLKALAALLSSHVRCSDVVCRFGGEEFVIVMPTAPAHIAQQRAEALRIAAHTLDVLHEGRRLDKMTISIGVATAPAAGQTREKLLEAADAALYRAKGDGRDRVQVAEVLRPQLLSAAG